MQAALNSERPTTRVIAQRYEVAEAYQATASGGIFRARDRSTGQDVAVETLALRGRSEDENRVQKRLRALVRLRHPRLVEVLDFGRTDQGDLFLVTELCRGPALSSISPLVLHDVLRALISAADLLAFIHVRGHTHGRLDSDHVRTEVRRSGALRLKLPTPLLETPERAAPSLVADLASLPPEARTGVVSPVSCDLYQLGVLVFEAATGSRPFRAESDADLIEAKRRPVNLHALRPAIPVPLSHLVRDLLDPEPSNRPRSALEVLGRVSELAEVVTHFDSGVALRAPELVGRADDLRIVQRAYARCLTGTPTSLILAGPAGRGKTRVSDEALIDLRIRGAVVARAQGHGFADVPFAVLRSLVASLLACPLAARVLARPDARKDLALLLPERPAGAVEGLDASTIRDALCQFVADLTAESPVVAEVDDIHLADDASTDALSALIESSTPSRFLLLGTRRSEEAVRPSLRILMMASLRHEIGPLDTEAVTNLVRHTLGVVPGQALIRDMLRCSGGNAYLLLELLRDAIARGTIVRRRAGFELPDKLASRDIPSSLSNALERRLGRLSPDALRVARVVAVLGRRTETSTVEELAGLAPDVFHDALEELRREEVVDRIGSGLAMHHPRVGDVLYEGMGTAERTDLHARIATEMKARLGGEAPEHAALIGHHMEAAGRRSEALARLVEAGDALYARGAMDDAGEAYKRAERLLDAASADERRRLAHRLSDRIGRVGFRFDHRGATEHLARARELHLQHGWLWLIPILHRYVGALLANCAGVGATVLWHLLHAEPRPLAATREHMVGAFAAGAYLSNCHAYAGSFRSAVEAAEWLRPFVCSAQGLPNAGRQMSVAPALVFLGELDAAVEACEQSLEVLTRNRDPALADQDREVAVAGALTTRMWCDLYRGITHGSPWRDRLATFVGAHATALNEAWLVEGDVFLGYRSGRIDVCREAWQRLAPRARTPEVWFVQGKARAWLGLACLQAGRTNEAMDLADTLLEHVKLDGNRVLRILGNLLRGCVLHAWGHLPDAASALRDAADVAAEPEVSSRLLGNWVALAQADLDFSRGAVDLAEVLSRDVRLSAQLPGRQNSLQQLWATQLLARIAAHTGDAARAFRLWTEALATATALHDRLAIGRCKRALAAGAAAPRELQP